MKCVKCNKNASISISFGGDAFNESNMTSYLCNRCTKELGEQFTNQADDADNLSDFISYAHRQILEHLLIERYRNGDD